MLMAGKTNRSRRTGVSPLVSLVPGYQKTHKKERKSLRVISIANSHFYVFFWLQPVDL